MPKPMTPEEYASRPAGTTGGEVVAAPSPVVQKQVKPIPPAPTDDEIKRRLSICEQCDHRTYRGECARCKLCGSRSCAKLAESRYVSVCTEGKWAAAPVPG